MEAVLSVFLLAVLAHSTSSRLAPARNRVASFVLIGSLAGAALIALLRWETTPPDQLVAMVFTYMLLCELYLFCFTMVLGSISANLLMLERVGVVR